MYTRTQSIANVEMCTTGGRVEAEEKGSILPSACRFYMDLFLGARSEYLSGAKPPPASATVGDARKMYTRFSLSASLAPRAHRSANFYLCS